MMRPLFIRGIVITLAVVGVGWMLRGSDPADRLAAHVPESAFAYVHVRLTSASRPLVLRHFEDCARAFSGAVAVQCSELGEVTQHRDVRAFAFAAYPDEDGGVIVASIVEQRASDRPDVLVSTSRALSEAVGLRTFVVRSMTEGRPMTRDLAHARLAPARFPSAFSMLSVLGSTDDIHLVGTVNQRGLIFTTNESDTQRGEIDATLIGPAGLFSLHVLSFPVRDAIALATGGGVSASVEQIDARWEWNQDGGAVFRAAGVERSDLAQILQLAVASAWPTPVATILDGLPSTERIVRVDDVNVRQLGLNRLFVIDGSGEPRLTALIKENSVAIVSTRNSSLLLGVDERIRIPSLCGPDFVRSTFAISLNEVNSDRAVADVGIYGLTIGLDTLNGETSWCVGKWTEKL
jgi:hypothetical protein